MTCRFARLFLLMLTGCFFVLAMPAQASVSANQSIQINAHFDDSAKNILLDFTIAPTFHLYKDTLSFTLAEPSSAELGELQLPPSQPFKQNAQTREVFVGHAQVSIPIQKVIKPKFVLSLFYQSCSDTICYPPTMQFLQVDTEQKQIHVQSGDEKIKTETPTATVSAPVNASKQNENIANTALKDGNLFHISLIFLGLGIALAFTPCVLPMIPILSSLILGQKKEAISTKESFLLSLCYVLGMGLAYALLGVLVGLLGSHLQASLQHPIVIIFTSLIFVAMSLSLFGFYDLQLPPSFQHWVAQWSNQQKAGTYFGVFIMGAFASLIISPCVSAPLVGALTYISQTGNALLGAFALFNLAFGMGTPLLLIGLSGGKWLPKAGVWMYQVKNFFGVLLVMMAIWLLGRILPATLLLFLWGSVLVISALFMGVFENHHTESWQRFWKGIGFIILIQGVVMIVGSSMGHEDPFTPLATTQAESITRTTNDNGTAIAKTNPFQRVHTLLEFQQALTDAKNQHKAVVFDYYADWCTACKEMETIFNSTEVNAVWQNMILIQADITHNDAAAKTLQETFKVFNPPTVLFFSPNGEEAKDFRVVGAIDKEDFLDNLNRFKESFSTE